MNIETQVLISVVLVDIPLISICVVTTPLRNEAGRQGLYQKLDLRTWLFVVGGGVFGIYNLYEWRTANLLCGGRGPWVSLYEHPIYFTALGVLWSMFVLMCVFGVLTGLAKILGIWRTRTAENSN
jgi:hypothetical protein